MAEAVHRSSKGEGIVAAETDGEVIKTVLDWTGRNDNFEALGHKRTEPVDVVVEPRQVLGGRHGLRVRDGG